MGLESLLLHPRTLAKLTALVTRPNHGILLTGPEGAGKRTVARSLAASLLKIDDITKLDAYPYFTVIDPDETVITIDEIRSAQRLLTLKTPGKSKEIRRVITVIDAERMRHEAQNAFLKTLEEPPADTVIILTAEGSEALLPTICSRLQRIEILPVSESMAKSYYALGDLGSADIAQDFSLSQGQAGLLNAMLQDSEHELKAWVDKAKQLLSMPADERLIKVDELSKDKAGVRLLLNALGRIAHAALLVSSKNGKEVAVRRWHSALERVTAANRQYLQNANLKLLLDDLFINL